MWVSSETHSQALHRDSILGISIRSFPPKIRESPEVRGRKDYSSQRGRTPGEHGLNSAHMNSQSLHSSLRHSTAPLVKFSSCLPAFCHTRSHLWKHSFPSVSLAWDDHSVDTRTCLMLQIPSLHRISEHCTYMGFAFYFGLDLQSHFKCF